MAQQTKFLRAFTAAALCFGASLMASPISRMDVFDKSDNHLLFVTFDYNATGTCIGRTVFASDSTFMYSTSFAVAGTAKKEISVDYNGNTKYTTTVNAPSGGATTFSTVDQFGLSQYGPSLSYTESATNVFSVSQNNGLLCKEQYEFNASGELTRISVSDKNGSPAWYALVTYPVAVQQQSVVKKTGQVRLSALRGKILLQFNLSTAGVVRAELVTPAGRRACVLVNERMDPGSHRYTAGVAQLSNGTYIVKMTIDGRAILTRKIVVQR